ncbi:MAG: hypothetical protein CSA66_07820 [Proteobacteria bacterium]|nr:MAG: hypothetical protein CSA66_07820 [Pseudomonadota bacterium]
MKKWTRMMIIAVSGLALAFAACDSDDGNGDGADTTQADTTQADTAPALTDQCLGADDIARISNEAKTDPATLAADCGTKACIAFALQGDFDGAKTCANDCMANGNADKEIPASELSEACASCYVNAVLCGAQHCLNVCAGDATSDACVSCRGGDNTAGVNCTGEFYSCSGLQN